MRPWLWARSPRSKKPPVRLKPAIKEMDPHGNRPVSALLAAFLFAVLLFDSFLFHNVCPSVWVPDFRPSKIISVTSRATLSADGPSVKILSACPDPHHLALIGGHALFRAYAQVAGCLAQPKFTNHRKRPAKFICWLPCGFLYGYAKGFKLVIAAGIIQNG